jgi:hypothetical protein
MWTDLLYPALSCFFCLAAGFCIGRVTIRFIEPLRDNDLDDELKRFLAHIYSDPNVPRGLRNSASHLLGRFMNSRRY